MAPRVKVRRYMCCRLVASNVSPTVRDFDLGDSSTDVGERTTPVEAFARHADSALFAFTMRGNYA